MVDRRIDALDALRGIAIVWMTLFHFGFDLSHFGFWRQDFLGDPFWTWQRTCIVSLFLACAGMGQAIAVRQGQGWSRFGRRWLQVSLCALLVSAGSWFMFPASFIYFGVLHGIALMLIIVRLTLGWGRWLWLAGALALAAKWLAAWAHAQWPELAFLNAPGWNSLGLIGRKPVTEDYVPLLPWLAAMWWGAAAGPWLMRQGWFVRGPLGWPLSAPLAWLGRWSLSWYMLHQPVLIGALTLVVMIRR